LSQPRIKRLSKLLWLREDIAKVIIRQGKLKEYDLVNEKTKGGITMQGFRKKKNSNVTFK
jgi:hypothetical protein